MNAADMIDVIDDMHYWCVDARAAIRSDVRRIRAAIRTHDVRPCPPAWVDDVPRRRVTL